MHPAFLLLPPLLLRLVPLPPRDGDRWRWGLDPLLAVVCGVLAGWLAWRLFPFYLQGSAVTASDFGEYCETVAAAAGDSAGVFSKNRSQLAALLPGAIARFTGPLDGLLLGALASVGIIGAGAYAWGRALHGRVAGIAAALLLGSVGPVVILSRTMSLYPEVTAGLVVCSATAAMMARWQRPWAFALAGAGAGVALLMDVRGLLWATPAVALGSESAGMADDRRNTPPSMQADPKARSRSPSASRSATATRPPTAQPTDQVHEWTAGDEPKPESGPACTSNT